MHFRTSTRFPFVTWLLGLAWILAVLSSTATALETHKFSMRLVLGPTSYTSGNQVGIGTAARIMKAGQFAGIPSDDSHILFADFDNHCIRKYNRWTTEMTTFAGLCGTSNSGFTISTTPASVRFNFPFGILYSTTLGKWLVAESNNQRVVALASDAGTAAFAGPTGSGPAAFLDGTGTAARFNAPRNMVELDSSTILVADPGNYRVRQITVPGAVVTTAIGVGSAGCASSTDVAVGSVVLTHPLSIALDSANRAWLADNGNIVLRTDAARTVIRAVLGTCSQAHNGIDGIGTDARITISTHLTFDPRTQSIFVVDRSVKLTVVDPDALSTATLAVHDAGATLADGRFDSLAKFGYINFPGPSVTPWGTLMTLTHRAVVEIWHGELTALYRLAGASGMDSSGHQRHMKLGSKPTQSTSRLGSAPMMCTKFYGTVDDTAVAPNAVMNYVSDFSVCLWMYPESAAEGTLLSVVDSSGTEKLRLYRTGTGTLSLVHVGITTITLNDATSVAQSSWTHACFVKEGVTARIYVDGVETSTGSGGTIASPPLKPGGVVVAARQGSVLGTYSARYIGRLEDIHVYNYALKDYDADQLYTVGSEGVEGTLMCLGCR